MIESKLKFLKKYSEGISEEISTSTRIYHKKYSLETPERISVEINGETSRKTLGGIVRKVYWEILRNITEETLCYYFRRIPQSIAGAICVSISRRLPVAFPGEIPRLGSVKISQQHS